MTDGLGARMQESERPADPPPGPAATADTGPRPGPAADTGPPLVRVLAETGGEDGRELAHILETMPAGFVFLDGEWRFRRVNEAAERLLATPRADLLGRSAWEVVPQARGTVYERSCRAAVESGRPVAFEAPALQPRTGWVEVRAWPAPDGLAIYVLDVTERRRAEEQARRATARIALLARVNTELSGALDGVSALGRLARLVVPTLTDGCIVTVVDREGHVRDVGSWHADPARRPLMERYARVRLDALPPASPVGRALQGGSPVRAQITTVLDLMQPGESRDLLGRMGAETAVVLPLATEDRTVGVLTLYLDPGRQVTDEDLTTARQVARQAALAVERVHRQSQQTQLAEGLQRSLLTRPPAIPGVRVAVRYVPAAEAARVGGDWYDAFLQQSGDAVVVIGDVVGHDTAAAAAMGQLRGLLRGIAHYSGAGPAEVLRGLDAAIASMHTGTLATAAVARLERTGGDGRPVLRWANAGHPPPALVTPDGTVTLLTGGGFDLMLGVDPAATRVESTATLPPDATVVLYTDGLIERRGQTLDEGLRRLRDQLAELASLPPEQLSDELLDRMLPHTPQDDVALVAMSLAPPGAGRDHSAEPDGSDP